MKETSSNVVAFPAQTTDVLTEILRQGAQTLLLQAIQAEVGDYVDRFKDLKDASGKRLVVRNGSMPEREIQTPLGQIPIKQPRVDDRRVDANGNRLRFESKILPPYLRKTKSMEELIPWLYLKGISTGDFTDALSALLGKDAPGLSATTIGRLKEGWQKDYEKWNQRSLENKHFIYIWADGIHFNVRLGEDERMCLLVVIGATLDGKKEVLAIESGYRESAMSWKHLLLNLRSRGLTTAPELAVGDGALGFWAALEEIYPTTKCQRCWVHKTANILDKLPKNKQPEAKTMIHSIYTAATKADAQSAFDRFLEVFDAKYLKATACLAKDRVELLAFYDFPAEHWQHIRTTNPIESTFATVRHRTKRTKGCGSTTATVTMVFKLAMCAEKKWQKLRGSKLLADVIDARFMFVDGLKKARAA
jgi:transposase-like protein